MRYLTSLSTVFLLLFAGCGFFAPPGWDTDDEYVDEWDAPPEYGVVDGRVESAWVGGEMADIGTFEGDAYQADYVGG
jgi:hypothetical protein